MKISTSVERQKTLKSIKPLDAVSNRQTLLEILQLEITDWKSETGPEIKENLYQCGFLLHIAGNYEDVELMYEARTINLETSCSFDVQNLVGGGVEETITYLEIQGLDKIADEIKAGYYYKDFDDLPKWIAFKKKYYYPED